MIQAAAVFGTQGGGIDYDVSVSTSLPDTVTNDKIVVITDVIPPLADGIIIDTVEPANPVEGMIYINNGIGPLAITKQGDNVTMIMRPGDTVQWAGSAWMRCNAYIGVDDEWEQVSYSVGTLEETSWTDISSIASSGLGANYWQVGDTKTITLLSPVLGTTTLAVQIMDFDYDDLADGTGKANISFGMIDCFATAQSMNPTDTNVGGWGNCAMQAMIENTVLPALIAVVGDGIIKPVAKRTSAGNKSASIAISTDSLWLLSEYEVFGVITNSAQGEKPLDKSACYAVFTGSSSRIKSKFWWERSPWASWDNTFCAVKQDGTATAYSASVPGGVVIGFCV